MSRKTIVTGNPGLDRVIGESRSVLFFGEAGSGKTTLLLTIASNICIDKNDPCLYISTEETLHYDRVARSPEKYANVFFTEIYDFDELFDFIVFKLPILKFRRVFIDSINSLYRVIASEEESITRYGLLLGMLWKNTVDRGGFLFASAQVRMGYEDEEYEVVASGMNILDYWFKTIIYLGWEDAKRAARIVKPEEYSGESYYFLISGEGIEWVHN